MLILLAAALVHNAAAHGTFLQQCSILDLSPEALKLHGPGVKASEVSLAIDLDEIIALGSLEVTSEVSKLARQYASKRTTALVAMELTVLELVGRMEEEPEEAFHVSHMLVDVLIGSNIESTCERVMRVKGLVKSGQLRLKELLEPLATRFRTEVLSGNYLDISLDRYAVKYFGESFGACPPTALQPLEYIFSLYLDGQESFSKTLRLLLRHLIDAQLPTMNDETALLSCLDITPDASLQDVARLSSRCFSGMSPMHLKTPESVCLLALLESHRSTLMTSQDAFILSQWLVSAVHYSRLLATRVAIILLRLYPTYLAAYDDISEETVIAIAQIIKVVSDFIASANIESVNLVFDEHVLVGAEKCAYQTATTLLKHCLSTVYTELQASQPLSCVDEGLHTISGLFNQHADIHFEVVQDGSFSVFHGEPFWYGFAYPAESQDVVELDRLHQELQSLRIFGSTAISSYSSHARAGTCPAGEYLTPSKSCAPCPIGFYCPGTGDYIPCEITTDQRAEYYYRGASSEDECYFRCPEVLYPNYHSRRCEKAFPGVLPSGKDVKFCNLSTFVTGPTGTLMQYFPLSIFTYQSSGCGLVALAGEVVLVGPRGMTTNVTAFLSGQGHVSFTYRVLYPTSPSENAQYAILSVPGYFLLTLQCTPDWICRLILAVGTVPPDSGYDGRLYGSEDISEGFKLPEVLPMVLWSEATNATHVTFCAIGRVTESPMACVAYRLSIRALQQEYAVFEASVEPDSEPPLAFGAPTLLGSNDGPNGKSIEFDARGQTSIMSPWIRADIGGYQYIRPEGLESLPGAVEKLYIAASGLNGLDENPFGFQPALLLKRYARANNLLGALDGCLPGAIRRAGYCYLGQGGYPQPGVFPLLRQACSMTDYASGLLRDGEVLSVVAEKGSFTLNGVFLSIRQDLSSTPTFVSLQILKDHATCCEPATRAKTKACQACTFYSAMDPLQSFTVPLTSTIYPDTVKVNNYGEDELVLRISGLESAVLANMTIPGYGTKYVVIDVDQLATTAARRSQALILPMCTPCPFLPIGYDAQVRAEEGSDNRTTCPCEELGQSSLRVTAYGVCAQTSGVGLVPPTLFLDIQLYRKTVATVVDGAVLFSYKEGCYDLEEPFVGIRAFEATIPDGTIFVSSYDPRETTDANQIYGKAAFYQASVNRLISIPYQGVISQRGSIYLWGHYNGIETAVREVRLCRKATPIRPILTTQVERTRLFDTPLNLVNETLLSDRRLLMAAGVISPERAYLAYLPVPLSLAYFNNTEPSRTSQQFYALIPGTVVNPEDVCTSRMEVEQSTEDRGSFSCLSFRDRVWKPYDPTKVPGILPGAVIYTVSLDIDSAPGPVAYLRYRVDPQIRERVGEILLSGQSAANEISPSTMALEAFIVIFMLGCIIISIYLCVSRYRRTRPGTLEPSTGGTLSLSEATLLSNRRLLQNFLGSPNKLWKFQRSSMLNLTSQMNDEKRPWMPFVELCPFSPNVLKVLHACTGHSSEMSSILEGSCGSESGSSLSPIRTDPEDLASSSCDEQKK
ncbi:hypothetical protein GMRT_11036 [Giardia muris]|uniref:Uncharacterized protein n=1 Tax=Giardia muris TaxID=5742 RepID=A0A4Z1SN79_GIAMU|nr:hypothetical protein GMRT_11036 [Giardia muris]|eukprot:TNJ27176.1 hypothetical protein GMRT_11036 [Giardia muris]